MTPGGLTPGMRRRSLATAEALKVSSGRPGVLAALAVAAAGSVDAADGPTRRWLVVGKTLVLVQDIHGRGSSIFDSRVSRSRLIPLN